MGKFCLTMRGAALAQPTSQDRSGRASVLQGFSPSRYPSAQLDVGRDVGAPYVRTFARLTMQGNGSGLPPSLSFRPTRIHERPGMSSEPTQIIGYGNDM